MWIKACLSAAVLSLAGWHGAAPLARADTGTTVTYAAGWNMVGTPPQTDLSAAAYLYAYGPAGYIPAQQPASGGCQGHWAFFNQASSVALTSPSGFDHQSCSLVPGWNLVGNPFAVDAILPSGTIAFYWNTGTQSYTQAARLRPGQAVWIHADAATTIDLIAASETGTGALTINGPEAGHHTVRLAEQVTLLMPLTLPYSAVGDPAHLRLENSGSTGGALFWTWRATSVGPAFIDLSPTCATSVPPCTLPSRRLEVDVVP